MHVCVLRGNQEAAPSAGFPSFTQWQMVGLQTCPSSSVGPTRKQTRTKSRKHDGRWGGQEFCLSLGANILSMTSMLLADSDSFLTW